MGKLVKADKLALTPWGYMHAFQCLATEEVVLGSPGQIGMWSGSHAGGENAITDMT
jgi:hypothetical protein